MAKFQTRDVVHDTVTITALDDPKSTSAPEGTRAVEFEMRGLQDVRFSFGTDITEDGGKYRTMKSGRTFFKEDFSPPKDYKTFFRLDAGSVPETIEVIYYIG